MIVSKNLMGNHSYVEECITRLGLIEQLLHIVLKLSKMMTFPASHHNFKNRLPIFLFKSIKFYKFCNTFEQKTSHKVVENLSRISACFCRSRIDVTYHCFFE